MEVKVKIAAVVVLLVASLFSASPTLARQSVPDAPEPAPVRYVTLNVDFGDDDGTHIRVREGGRATITLHEEGITYGLVPYVQESGDISVQIFFIENPGVTERVSLLETVILPYGEESDEAVVRGMQVLQDFSPMTISLVRASPTLFRAKPERSIGLDPDGNQQTSRKCCLSCNGRSYCGCEVETACGGYCCAWICCNLEWD